MIAQVLAAFPFVFSFLVVCWDLESEGGEDKVLVGSPVQAHQLPSFSICS